MNKKKSIKSLLLITNYKNNVVEIYSVFGN
jgi:hypothetical protein